jgi:hypothetical protein
VPGAYWALVEDEEVELRRTAYDIEAALRLLPRDHPNRDMREQWIRGPHDPAAIAQRIESARQGR